MQAEELYNDLKAVKEASYSLQDLDQHSIKNVLMAFASALRSSVGVILSANEKDLSRMERDNPLYDRLLLDGARLAGIASDVEKVADLASPVDEVMDQRKLPNGIDLSRVRVPVGVVAAIYEARPNVTMDVFSLCFRTQNACVLRGGTDAHHTNVVTVGLMQDVLKQHGIDPHIVYLMPPEREFVPVVLKAHGLIDVCIPRGSQALIDFVREEATVPVIETGRGVVHVYFDESGDLVKGQDIILNAKTRRPSVCNSLDTLLLHRDRVADIEVLMKGLSSHGVRINADQTARTALDGFYPQDLLGDATAETYDAEFLGLQMNVKIVDHLDDALSHIRQYGSGHTEAIVTSDKETGEEFLKAVDAAVVMVNSSTAFSDGGEFGLGAEIGISTQKLHARGPMGLEPLTSYKWLLRGTGQVRNG